MPARSAAQRVSSKSPDRNVPTSARRAGTAPASGLSSSPRIAASTSRRSSTAIMFETRPPAPQTTTGGASSLDQARCARRRWPSKKRSSSMGMKWAAIGRSGRDRAGGASRSSAPTPTSAASLFPDVVSVLLSSRRSIGASPSPARAAATRNSGEPSSAIRIQSRDIVGGGAPTASRPLRLTASHLHTSPSAASARWIRMAGDGVSASANKASSNRLTAFRAIAGSPSLRPTRRTRSSQPPASRSATSRAAIDGAAERRPTGVARYALPARIRKP